MDYTPDYDARTAKREELVAIAREELGDLAEYADKLVDMFVELSPPQDPPMALELIQMNRGGRGGGRTRKPGNIRLNWRKLFNASPDLIFTGVGAVATPWLIPLAALSIFDKIWSQSAIELTKEQSTCLFAMWHRCDHSQELSMEEAFSCSQQLFTVYKWEGPTDVQFGEIIDELKRLRCIESKGEGRLWLKEWVSSPYS